MTALSTVVLIASPAQLCAAPTTAPLTITDTCDVSCFEPSISLDDYTVQCVEDLDALTCPPDSVILTNTCTSVATPMACVLASRTDTIKVCQATTAYGIGGDAALRVYGLELSGLVDSDLFMETGDGLVFTQYANDVAVLEGEVVCDQNSNQGFEVFIVFQNRVDGADWTGGFKQVATCGESTDDWDIYLLKNGQSFLRGTGDLEGSMIELLHAPASEFFGFQVGQGANNHNCEYGAGGWFAWVGQIGGTPVAGAMGDVIVDLECGSEFSRCGASVDFIHTALDTQCGPRNIVQHVERADDTAPVFTDFPADLVLACTEPIPAVPTIEATDNCSDPTPVLVEFLGEVAVTEVLPGCYTLNRTWRATDACGNVHEQTQIIEVVDLVSPEFTFFQCPADTTLYKDADCFADISVEALGNVIVEVEDNCDPEPVVIIDISDDDQVEACEGAFMFARWFTVTATDACGNQSLITEVQWVTVLDEIDPSWTVDLPADLLVECTAVPEPEVLSGEDNCTADPEVELAELIQQTECEGIYTITRTWTLSDDCGNAISHTQEIEVVDTAPPVWDQVMPADTVVDCHDVPLALVATASDPCDSELTLTFDESETPGDCPQERVLTRVWTATDCAQNTTEHVQVLTVVDTIAPSFVELLPADMEAPCDGIPAAETLTATDLCDAAPSVSFEEEIIGDCPSTYLVRRTWTAQDACGNETAHVQDIQLVDDVSPAFVEPLPGDLTVSCDAIPEPDVLTATDQCDNAPQVEMVEVTSDDACANDRTVTRTWTATDCAGNTTVHTQVISLYDIVAPEMIGDEILEIECDVWPDALNPSFEELVAAGIIDATDNCDMDTVIIEYQLISGGCFLDRILTYTPVDACGNVGATLQQLVIIHDTQAPEFGFVPNDTSLMCTEDVEAYLIMAEAHDNCDPDVEMTYDDDLLDDGDGCPETYQILRTFTAEDCGYNSATASQLISVIDTVGPAIDLSCPADVSLTGCLAELDTSAASLGLAEYTALDACGSAVASSTSRTDVVTVLCETTDGEQGGSYSIERTFIVTATDCSGNTSVSSCTQIITTTDDQAPEFEGELEVEMDCALWPAVPTFDDIVALGLASVTENCLLDGVTVEQIAEFSSGCRGMLSMRYTATDACGNSSILEQLVQLVDTTGPVFDALPADLTLNCGDELPSYVDGSALATDACGGEVTIETADETFISDCSGVMTVTRTITAADICGNETQHQQIFDFIDDEAPVLSDIPADLTVDCGLPEVQLPTAIDGCGGEVAITVEDDTLSQTCANSFEVERIYTATDCSGNASQASQLITVIDEESPVILAAPEISLSCELFACDFEVLLALGAFAASDNCGAPALTASCASVSGGCIQPEGAFVVTYTATDACGNSTQAIQVVTLFDSTAPTAEITCPADITLVMDADCQVDLTTTNTGAASASAQDNCDSDPAVDVEYEDADPVFNCEGGLGGYTIERTFTATATDDCGNATAVTCTQTISVLDETSPELSIECPPDVEMAGCLGEVNVGLNQMGDVSFSATDNCGGVTVESSFSDSVEPTCVESADDATPEGGGLITRTFTVTATDCEGNVTEASCSQSILLLDEEAPALAITCPADANGNLDADCAADLSQAAIGSATAEASDNCDSEVAVTITAADGPLVLSCAGDDDTPQGSYTMERTFTATAVDDCGNATQSQCTQLVTLTDNTAPDLSIDGPADAVVLLDGDCQADATTSVTGLPVITAADGCDSELALNTTHVDSELTMLCAGDDGQPEGSYSFTRTFTVTATDDCGNTSSATSSQLIEVLDQTAPEHTSMEILGTDTLQLDALCFADLTPPVSPTSTAEDGCDSELDIEVTYTDAAAIALCEPEAGDDLAEGSQWIVRTWTSVATDDCGNVDTEYTQQDLILLDEVAPQITETCGLANAEVVQFDCPGVGILDFDELPAPCDVEAIDNCDSQVAVDLSETLSEFVPSSEVCNHCGPTTPAALADGQTCDELASEAMNLFNFNGVSSLPFEIDVDLPRTFQVGCDSALHVLLHLTDGAGGGMIFEANYEGAYDWANWSDPDLEPTGAHSFKKDCPSILPLQSIWEQWTYFFLTEGTMTGTGNYSGSSFTLTHQPSNGYYGFQVGLGANNKNDAYGASGWFFWNGNLTVDGEDLGPLASSGDLFLDLDCCLPWSVDYDYMASDDCGNATPFSYTVEMLGEVSEDGAGVSGPGGPVHNGDPINISTGSGSIKTPLRITGLQPNPTADISQLSFEVTEVLRLRVDLYTMSGLHVNELFDGMATTDVVYQLPIDVANLAAGMYQIRLSGDAFGVVRKLLVSP